MYVRDLGLISPDDPVRIANPIYREVIPRALTYTTQAMLAQETAWYVGDDGDLHVGKLLTAFQAFFREHAEHWVERFQYKEAGPQLLLQAFLQRIVPRFRGGRLRGGRIEREYGLGRGRTDLLIAWPQGEQTRKLVPALDVGGMGGHSLFACRRISSASRGWTLASCRELRGWLPASPLASGRASQSGH